MNINPADCLKKIGHCWVVRETVAAKGTQAIITMFLGDVPYRRKCRHCGLVQQLAMPEYETVSQEMP